MRRLDVIRRTTTPSRDIDLFVDVRELETLRSIIRREIRVHGGQRTLAQEIGIDRGSLRKFASGQSVPTPHTLARIREWAADRPAPAIPMAAVAVAILSDEFAPLSRPAARHQIAATLGAIYQNAGLGIPTWIRDETGATSGESVVAGTRTSAAPPEAVQLLLHLKSLLTEYEPEGSPAPR